jgi:hypothetical protein
MNNIGGGKTDRMGMNNTLTTKMNQIALESKKKSTKEIHKYYNT